MAHHRDRRTDERVHLELASGVILDLRVPHTPHARPDLSLEVAAAHYTVSGRDLHVNLHDDSPGFTIRVQELDKLGVNVDAADEIPVNYALDRDDVVTVTDNGDLTASGTIVGPGAVGQTAVVTVSATLPDGTAAQGSVAIAVVPGGVASLTVDATEDTATG